MSDPAALRRKALAALREGRVTIVHMSDDSRRITAAVRSSRKESSTVHVIDGIHDSNWHCTCQPVFAPPCAHIEAVRMVTDHGGVL